MSPPWALEYLQTELSYKFAAVSLLEKALVAGDSNSHDREGHRGMAQLGNSLMESLMMSDGIERGLSRAEQQEMCSNARSKKFCSDRAKKIRLHECITPCERQTHVGVQPTTLKNAVSALVGAVWLDSHDYKAVLRVLKSIGFLYHTQDSSLASVDSVRHSVPPYVFNNAFRPMESDRIDSDYWSLLPEEDRNLDCLFPEQSTTSYSHPARPTPAEPSASLGSTPDHVSFPSQGTSDQGNDHEIEAPLTPGLSDPGSLPSQNDARGVRKTRDGIGQDKHIETDYRNLGKVTKRKPRPRLANRRGVSRTEGPGLIIETYVVQELGKDSTPWRRDNIVDVMNAYQEAISNASATVQPSLAVLATSIGDSSALKVLQKAIQGLRSPQMSDWLQVDRQMSVAERVRIIEQVGACTEFLRLARLLHIVTLWEDLSRMAQDGSDGFVVTTVGSVAQHKKGRKGNPLNLARAEVAHGLSDLHDSQYETDQSSKGQEFTRLRHLGQRLGLLVTRWGYGVLLTLGCDFSDRNMLKPSEKAFKGLIEIMDQHEGARISAVSAAALPILEDFRKGNQIATRLRLEFVSDDEILGLPRLSTGFEGLLAPVDDGGSSVLARARSSQEFGPSEESARLNRMDPRV